MDLYLFNLINQFALKWYWLDYLGFFLAECFPYLLILILLFLAIKNFRLVAGAISAGLLARLVASFIYWLWPRPRPFITNDVNLLFTYNGSSFPSGHAVFFFAISTVIYLHNKKLGAFFFLSSALIVLARVFSGVHWPSDILVGALIGIIIGYLVFKIIKK